MSFEITTDRLILRVEDSTKAADILTFYKKNAALFDQYEPTRPNNFYTLAYQNAATQYEYNEIIKGKTLRYYVYLKEQPDIIIGSVNFSKMEPHPFCKASIGYKFDKDYHGNGYALEACKASIPIIFSNYRIHRLEARVQENNTASIKLLERLGFIYEGIEYQGVEINGVYQDHHRYSLLSI